MIRPIVRYGAAVLHAPASPVDQVTAETQQLIDDMIQTMYAAPGVGIAAPRDPHRGHLASAPVIQQPPSTRVPS